MSKKGAALFIVLAAVLIVVIFANIILSITSNQGRFTHHQSSRIRAYYAAQAGMVYALEKLRTGNWTAHPTEIRYACLAPNGTETDKECIDASAQISTYFKAVPFFDLDIPYKIQIAIYPKNQPGIGNTTKLEIKTDYTY